MNKKPKIAVLGGGSWATAIVKAANDTLATALHTEMCKNEI